MLWEWLKIEDLSQLGAVRSVLRGTGELRWGRADGWFTGGFILLFIRSHWVINKGVLGR